MLSEREYEGFLNQAKMLYSHGHNDRYIILQLADKKVPDDDIDLIMKEVKSLRRYNLRQQGYKELFFGFMFVVAGILMAYYVVNMKYFVRYVALGLPLAGVSLMVKGLFNVLGW